MIPRPRRVKEWRELRSQHIVAEPVEAGEGDVAPEGRAEAAVHDAGALGGDEGEDVAEAGVGAAGGGLEARLEELQGGNGDGGNR